MSGRISGEIYFHARSKGQYHLILQIQVLLITSLIIVDALIADDMTVDRLKKNITTSTHVAKCNHTVTAWVIISV